MEIKDIVREYYDSSAFNQSTRKREVVTERQVNHFLYTSLTLKKLEEIAAEFKPPNKEKMNHATILNSMKTVRALYETNKKYRNQFDILLLHLKMEGYETQKIYNQLNTKYGSGRKHHSKRFVPKSRGLKRVRQRQERRFVISGTTTEVRLGESFAIND